MNWLDKIPFLPLLLIAILLGMAPYPSQPQPHLLEKLVMLSQGNLSKPIDIFDLFLHGTPAILLLLKGIRALGKSRAT
jgi:hypothetical protein